MIDAAVLELRPCEGTVNGVRYDAPADEIARTLLAPPSALAAKALEPHVLLGALRRRRRLLILTGRPADHRPYWHGLPDSFSQLCAEKRASERAARRRAARPTPYDQEVATP